LIDNPHITPLLHGRLGGDVKLDHEYVQTLKPDGSGRPSISGGKNSPVTRGGKKIAVECERI